MIDRKLSSAAPLVRVPKGAIDSQMHMYLPGFAMRADGVRAPADPLPDPAMYRQVMGWLGIDRVVITQGNAHGTDNASLLACIAQMGGCARNHQPADVLGIVRDDVLGQAGARPAVAIVAFAAAKPRHVADPREPSLCPREPVHRARPDRRCRPCGSARRSRR